MQRRGGSEQPVKGQSANWPARNAQTAQVSTADLQEQLDRTKRERDEALEQQAATVEVLRAISSSVGKLEPDFRHRCSECMRLCGQVRHMLLFHGEAFTIEPRIGDARRLHQRPLAEPFARRSIRQLILPLVETKKQFMCRTFEPTSRTSSVSQSRLQSIRAGFAVS